MKKFKLVQRFPNENSDVLKNYYSNWKMINRSTNAPFLTLYNSFKDEHLATLDPGPLRLYLYFAFHAKNETGHSWHSIQTIADFFNTQTRTINNWIKVLVDKELIYRERTDKLSNTTFLIPYSNSLVHQIPSKKHKNDDQGLLDDLVSIVKRREFLYGKIINVFHLFQWVLKKGNPDNQNNLLLIVTRRKNGIIIGHYYALNNSSDFGVKEIEIDELAKFESPFEYKGEGVKGIALNSSTSIRSIKNSKTFIDLCEQLIEAEQTDFDLLPRVEYDEITEFLKEFAEKPENVEGEEEKDS